MSGDPLPDLISTAGEKAVEAYLAFSDQPEWGQTTRTRYRQQAARFFRWIDARGIFAIMPPKQAASSCLHGAMMVNLTKEYRVGYGSSMNPMPAASHELTVSLR